jgi:hypothetical protein
MVTEPWSEAVGQGQDRFILHHDPDEDNSYDNPFLLVRAASGEPITAEQWSAAHARVGGLLLSDVLALRAAQSSSDAPRKPHENTDWCRAETAFQAARFMGKVVEGGRVRIGLGGIQGRRWVPKAFIANFFPEELSSWEREVE